MKKLRNFPRASLVLLVVVILLLSTIPFNLAQGETYSITWSPKQVALAVPQGESTEINVTFSSDTDLVNASLWVVPKLQPYVTVSPNAFGSITAGVNNSVTITVSVPADTQPGSYEGTLHLRIKSRTYPQTLKINLKVISTAKLGSPVMGKLGSPTVEPMAITAGIPTNVLISTELTDPNLIPSTVSLQRLDVNNNVIETLGVLTDDGTKGDTLPDDNIYTIEINFTEPQAGEIRLRISANFTGELEPLFSNVFTVEVTLPEVPNEPSPSDMTKAVYDPQSEGEIISNEILISFVPEADLDSINQIASSLNGTIIGRIPELGVWQVRIPGTGDAQGVYDVINTLMANPLVEFAEPNGVVEPTAVIPNDPLYPQQWSLPKSRADEAWVIGRGSSSILIAIVDTGVDFTHPDLTGKVILGKDFITGAPIPWDNHGHGTHVAGIASTWTNNGTGIAGTSWYSRLLSVKVLGPRGGTSLSVARGILYSADKGAKVINLSLGSYSSSLPIWLAVIYADWKNRLVVAASGNDTTSKKHFPAAYSAVLAVGATDQNDNRSPFSNFGSWVDIAAPGGDGSWNGGDILSTLPVYHVTLNNPPYNRNHNYDHMPGTSMATPFVSGAAAVLWAKHLTWSDEQIRERLEKTAKYIGQGLGRGRVDLFDTLFNGSFETGDLSEWSGFGTVGVISSLGPLKPTRGKYMAWISTGPGGANVSSTLNHYFTVLPGTTSLIIRMDYNFVTEEYPEWVGTIYNDYFRARIVTSTGKVIPLAFESVNSSSFIPVWGIDFPGGDYTVGMTGWKTVSATVPIDPGTDSIRLFVTDVGDEIYDSVVLIDNVRFK